MLVGLNVDLVSAAETVEVVGIQRAQVHLQGVEDVADGHTMGLGLFAVDGGIDLRHVDLIAGEHRHRVQLRQLTGLVEDVLGLRVQLFIAQVATVLNLQAETTDGAQALYRRRREDGEVGFLNFTELAVELGGDGAGRHVFVLAQAEVLERDENDAAVGAVGEAVDRQAREGHGVFHARMLAGDFAHALDHHFGAIERRRVWQLGEGHQVLLVLLRHEAGRSAGETQVAEHQQAAVDQHGDAATTQHATHGADVAVAGALEHAIERGEQPATEQLVEPTREGIFRRVVILEQDGGQGRRQGQRVDGRNHRGNGDGQRELLVELARKTGDEGRRHEHRAQHQGGGDDGTSHLLHGLASGLDRRFAQGDVALDVFHHHDGVVHHDTDGQHQAEQRQGVEREAEHVHDREGADQRYRHGSQGDDRGAPGLQEQHDHQHHQHHGFEQGVHHRLDGAADEDGRVIHHFVVHALREGLLQLGHAPAYRVGNLDGIGARALEHRDGHGRLVVQQRAQGVLVGAQFDAGDVAQAGDFAVVADADDDVLELFLGDQAALSVDRQLETVAGIGRRRAEGTSGDLAVLFADGGDHVGGGEPARGDLVRVEPDAQRVVAHTEQLYVADAVQARQLVLDVERGVVGQVEHVVALIRRGQVHHHGQVRGGLVHGHAETLHFGRQGRHGAGDAVLHLHLGVVQVGTEGEGHGQRQAAINGRLRRHVEHALDADDGLLQRRGDGFTDHLGVGAGKIGTHHDGRRHHFRVFADRQLEQRDGAADQDQQRQHRGEDRPLDEELREIHESFL